jgi:fibronectin type 3 domain-containing protein
MDKAVGHKTGNIVYWNAVANAKFYQVYRLRSGETTWTLLTNTGSLAYKDTTAEVGVKYYYKVVARNGDIKSGMNISSVSAIRPN